MSHELIPMQEVMDLGTVLAKSGYFTDSRDAAQAVVKVLAGRELGFGPIASMTGVYIVKGKVALSANLMAAAIKRSGRYNYRVLHLGDDACRLEFYENGQSLGVSEFTMADAKRAGLGGDNWTKYPRNMLFARALSNGAKWYCPDLSGGPLYTPDELGAVIDGESGEVIDVEPVRTEQPTQRTQPPLGTGLNADGSLPAHLSKGTERKRQQEPQATTNGNGHDQPSTTTSTAHSELPFRPSIQGAVEWAIKEAPEVWEVDSRGMIVEKRVENSFRTLIDQGLAGDALIHAWIDKVHGKQADFEAGKES